jgi:hypothetical protein
MSLLLAIVSANYLVMPAYYLRDSVVVRLLDGEDIRVFYGEQNRKVRFEGLAADCLLWEEGGWEKERRGLDPEHVRLDVSEADSVWVYLPLHEIKKGSLAQEALFGAGGCLAGMPVGVVALTGVALLTDPCKNSDDWGCGIGLGFTVLYGGSALGGIAGCGTGIYFYESRALRPLSPAKTQLFLGRIMELGGSNE